MKEKTRLDRLLTDRGNFDSRSQAAASIMAGRIRVGKNRQLAKKPGQMVSADVAVEIDPGPSYVSRGGIKMASALDSFLLSVEGLDCLDIGASTGGFTDCLLKRGAARVVALDVGYGELSWSLRNDSRVTVIERTNARSLNTGMLPFTPALVCIDVSFISLEKVLPAVFAVGDENTLYLALVKPQFEVGRDQVGKNGVVRDPELRRQTLVDIGRFFQRQGYAVIGFASSGLMGPAGNRESFILATEHGSGVSDLIEASFRAEPSGSY